MQKELLFQSVTIAVLAHTSQLKGFLVEWARVLLLGEPGDLKIWSYITYPGDPEVEDRCCSERYVHRHRTCKLWASLFSPLSVYTPLF